MSNWFRQHALALAAALLLLRRAPASFLFNVLVVAIALALPFAGLTLLENVRPVAEQLSVEPEISLFLALDTPHDKAVALAPAIRNVLQANKKNARIEFLPREKALNQIKSKSGLADVLNTLEANPLPDGYVLKLAGFADGTDAARIDTIAKQLEALPGVETVQVDSAWVKRLAALLSVLRMGLLILGATLGLVVVAVVFNTIRLQVMAHRDEMALSKLVGATDAFIRRPFYYAGALLGAGAGTLALVAVALVLQPLNSGIAEFARLYASEFRLTPLGAPEIALLLLLSALLGLAGAALSTRRHLARLD